MAVPSSYGLYVDNGKTFPVSHPQDQLSADLYSFSSKEGDYARYYVTVSAPQLRWAGTKLEMGCEYDWIHYNNNIKSYKVSMCFIMCSEFVYITFVYVCVYI